MGNLCGKESSDSFAQPGRVLGTAPEQPTTASVPAKRTVGGPPRALGGGGGGGSPATGQSSADNDARRRAAAAAEERAKRNSAPAGKLGEQLKAQKAQTRADTLKEASETNRRQRDADASAATLSHN